MGRGWVGAGGGGFPGCPEAGLGFSRGHPERLAHRLHGPRDGDEENSSGKDNHLHHHGPCRISD